MSRGQHDSSNVDISWSDAVYAQSNRTWFPILAGVLAGLIVFCILVLFRVRISLLVFDEMNYKELDSMPGFCWVLRTALIMLTCIGGGIGIAFSKWNYAKSVLFLLGAMVVIAIFGMLGLR